MDNFKKPGCVSTTERPDKDGTEEAGEAIYDRPAGTNIEDYGQWGDDDPCTHREDPGLKGELGTTWKTAGLSSMV